MSAGRASARGCASRWRSSSSTRRLTTNDPLAEAIRRADLAALWRAIEALPRQQRDALLLREFGGLSYGELSAALAVSGAAVESLLFRARQRLRGQLRAVYAAVSGASWIDALVRLFAGGGAPVAAKVAVLGAGAAVVGSTAVVVPNVLDNHPARTTRSALPPPWCIEARPARLRCSSNVSSRRRRVTPRARDAERRSHASRASTTRSSDARGFPAEQRQRACRESRDLERARPTAAAAIGGARSGSAGQGTAKKGMAATARARAAEARAEAPTGARPRRFPRFPPAGACPRCRRRRRRQLALQNFVKKAEDSH